MISNSGLTASFFKHNSVTQVPYLLPLLWYRFAMVRKSSFLFLILLFALPVVAQQRSHAEPAADLQSAPNRLSSPEAAPATATDLPQPRIRVAEVAPVQPAPPAPWLMRDRIAWSVNIILVLLGYGGILLAMSLLHKMERALRVTETLAESASEQSSLAMQTLQKLQQAERPWLSISIVQQPAAENTFTVLATNCGKSPARLLGCYDAHLFVASEADLPPAAPLPEAPSPDYSRPILLLPGESARLRSLRREQVKEFCGDAEGYRKVLSWESKIYLFGKVVYEEVSGAQNRQPYESSWCCWYIHGERNSGLIFSGPKDYNSHS